MSSAQKQEAWNHVVTVLLLQQHSTISMLDYLQQQGLKQDALVLVEFAVHSLATIRSDCGLSSNDIALLNLFHAFLAHKQFVEGTIMCTDSLWLAVTAEEFYQFAVSQSLHPVLDLTVKEQQQPIMQ